MRSLWLQETLGREVDAPAAAVEGALRADVCIIGGGFTGLWTAYRLTELEPALDIVIVEADVCGGGASGRNGGFVAGWTPKLATLVRLFGVEDALRLTRATLAAVTWVEEFCAEQAPDADFERGGWLWTATSEAQRGAWQGAVDAAERVGLDVFRPLAREELEARLGPSRHLAGVLDVTGAKVQPAALVRALRRTVVARGVRVLERSPVRSLRSGAEVVVRCERGEVRAPTAILAANAWLAHLPDFRRSLIVTSSDVVATAARPERLAAQGWTGGETVSNSRLMLAYYRTTRDGRIVLGRGGGTLAFANRIGPAFEHSARQARAAARDVGAAFPGLSDLPIEQAWSGPIDRSESGLPWFGPLAGDERVLFGIGFSGNGVGPCAVGGRILASLALRRDDEWASLAGLLARLQRGGLPPEPARYLAGKAIQAGVAAKERAEDGGREPSSLAVRLARLVPQGAGVHDVQE